MSTLKTPHHFMHMYGGTLHSFTQQAVSAQATCAAMFNEAHRDGAQIIGDEIIYDYSDIESRVLAHMMGDITGAHCAILKTLIHDEEFYNLPDLGHDPYAHHGRFMHNFSGTGRISSRYLMQVDDYSTSYDPRNHQGSRL